MSNELQHFGILGMKWGKRKSAGPKTEKKRKRTITPSDDARVTKELRGKKISEMSNKELQTLVTRMNLEQQYSKLNPSAANKGRSFLAKKGGKLMNAVTDKLLEQAASQIVKKAFK